MSSEWRRGPIDPATVPEGAMMAHRVPGDSGHWTVNANFDAAGRGLEHRLVDPECGAWIDWLEPEPAWVAECRAALEPVLGVGEWQEDYVWFGNWTAWKGAPQDMTGHYIAHQSNPAVEGAGFVSWPHAAEFIRAAQEQAAGEVADWLGRRFAFPLRETILEQLRSGAWRGE